MPRVLAVLFLSIFLLAGCAGVEPAAYRNEKPALDLFRYFEGTTDGWGVFTDRAGKVVKRFTVVIRGTVSGDTLVLDEAFTYSDGMTQTRVWTIRRAGDTRFTGTAADVVGAADGVVAGNALQWRYVLALEVDGRTWHVDFDDWMYLQDDAVMLNRSVMSKFGLRLGELFLAFRRRG
ncbi:MAG TPA: DUF3833 domain-containing protein [Burkholderiales bacterium]